MKVGETWIDKEDSHEVVILELTIYPSEGEVIWYEYNWDQGGANYLQREEFLKLFRKKY